MATAERALELAAEDEAEALRYRAIERRHLDLADQLHARDFASYAEMHEGRAAIIRHYAEILPKWQAALNAELVDVRGVRDEWDSDGEVIQCLNVASANGVTEGTQLIIKPAP